MLRDWEAVDRMLDACIQHGLTQEERLMLVKGTTTEEEANALLKLMEENPDATYRDLVMESRRIHGRPM